MRVPDPIRDRRLKAASEAEIYGVIGTNTKRTTISASLATRIGAVIERERGGVDKERTQRRGARITVVICDRDFNPWLRFTQIPVSVINGAGDDDDHNECILGFDSLLAHLRLKVDYPAKLMTLSSRSEFLISDTPPGITTSSSRITEANNLLKAGSFDAAVIMFSAALEETIAQFLETQKDVQSIDLASKPGLLRKFSMSIDLSPKLRGDLEARVAVRNKVVHGSNRERVTRRDAEEVQRVVAELISWIQSTYRQRIPQN